jgi:ABC-2 type transport system ATP-binding protein
MEEADKLCSRVLIMNRGKAAITGSPAELKAMLGKKGATLDDVFVHYAGDSLESVGAYRDAARERQTEQRVG